jgi:hypothetical protein
VSPQEFYAPGNVIKSGKSGYRRDHDLVLSFNADGLIGWEVHVTGVEPDGAGGWRRRRGERERHHFTLPDKRDVIVARNITA